MHIIVNSADIGIVYIYTHMFDIDHTVTNAFLTGPQQKVNKLREVDSFGKKTTQIKEGLV